MLNSLFLGGEGLTTKRVLGGLFSQSKRKKTYCHIPNLVRMIVTMRLEDNVGMNQNVVLEADDPRRLSKNLAPVAPPPTQDIVETQKSRFVDLDKTIDHVYEDPSSNQSWNYVKLYYFKCCQIILVQMYWNWLAIFNNFTDVSTVWLDKCKITRGSQEPVIAHLGQSTKINQLICCEGHIYLSSYKFSCGSHFRWRVGSTIQFWKAPIQWLFHQSLI